MKPTPNIPLRIAVIRDGRPGRKIAVSARVHPSTFSAILAGRIIPTEHEQERIAKALKRTVHELFSDEAKALAEAI